MPLAALLALLMLAMLLAAVGRAELEFRRNLARRARILARRHRPQRC